MDIIDFATNNLIYIVGILLILVVVMYLLVIKLFYNLSYMKKRYKKMMAGVDGANLERTLMGCIDSTKSVVDENARLWEENKAIKELLSQAMTKVAVVRFRAFEDMGSDLSYAVAMLDSQNNGVVLSSIFAREDSRSYAKPIVNGQSTYAMTAEEQDALQQAMAK